MKVWLLWANGRLRQVLGNHELAEKRGFEVSRVNGPAVTVSIEGHEVHSGWEPEHGDSRCQDCGAVNVVWFAENALWNQVMGGPEAIGDPGGVVCVLRFDRRAEQALGRRQIWKLVPE